MSPSRKLASASARLFRNTVSASASTHRDPARRAVAEDPAVGRVREQALVEDRAHRPVREALEREHLDVLAERIADLDAGHELALAAEHRVRVLLHLLDELADEDRGRDRADDHDHDEDPADDRGTPSGSRCCPTAAGPSRPARWAMRRPTRPGPRPAGPSPAARSAHRARRPSRAAPIDGGAAGGGGGGSPPAGAPGGAGGGGGAPAVPEPAILVHARPSRVAADGRHCHPSDGPPSARPARMSGATAE